MHALISKVEEAHHKELQLAQVELQTLSEHLTDGEATSQTLEQRVTVLERDRLSPMDIKVALQLQLEDQILHNNLRLWGIPEATDQENL